MACLVSRLVVSVALVGAVLRLDVLPLCLLWLPFLRLLHYPTPRVLPGQLQDWLLLPGQGSYSSTIYPVLILPPAVLIPPTPVPCVYSVGSVVCCPLP